MSPGPPLTVMVELTAPPVTAPLGALDLGASLPGFTRDPDFEPVPMSPEAAGGGATVVIRGTVDTADDVASIEQQPQVVRVWAEGRLEGFGSAGPHG